MGKSPGKWIKTVLLGRKASRSTSGKGKNAPRTTSEKETWVAAKEPTTDFPVDPPSVSEPITDATYIEEGSLVVENVRASDFPCDEEGTLLQTDKQQTTILSAADDPERSVQEQAVIKTQAAFRGYLARRAFRALKGIIRLQALVRGHLVRRQAIATLCCLQRIIKFQALVRGRKIKLSDADLEVHKQSSFRNPLDGPGLGSIEESKFITRMKLSENAFVCKLLRSSTIVVPLRFQYDLEEPNSAWNWLERWTFSRLCEPVTQTKKVGGLKSQLRQDQGRSKRTVRKVPAANVDNGIGHSTSEPEKPKRNLRKGTSPSVDPVQEQPQNEFEKVKRNLRKVSNLATESNGRVDVEGEKPKRGLRKPSSSQTSDIPDKITCDSAEKIIKNLSNDTEISKNSPTKETSSLSPDIPGSYDFAEKMTVKVASPVPKDPDVILTPKPLVLVSDVPVDVLHNDLPPLDLQPLENIKKDENILGMNGVEISKEDQVNHDNQKTSRRRASFTPKEENPENGLQNSPTVPSYMAVTESAKAKLRGQCSPKLSQEVVEKIGTRRHSLPSSTNGKLNSSSPRTQRLGQTNGKGGIKNDKSLLSSRDGTEKAAQAGWRR